MAQQDRLDHLYNSNCFKGYCVCGRHKYSPIKVPAIVPRIQSYCEGLGYYIYIYILTRPTRLSAFFMG